MRSLCSQLCLFSKLQKDILPLVLKMSVIWHETKRKGGKNCMWLKIGRLSKTLSRREPTLLQQARKKNFVTSVQLWYRVTGRMSEDTILLYISLQWRRLWLLTRLHTWASLVAQTVKNLPVIQETLVWSLGQEDPLEKEKATHSSILA